MDMKKINEFIILRKPDFSDIDELYILKNDEYSNSQLGGFNNGYSKEDIRNWIHFHNSQTNEIVFVIQEVEHGKLIGHVGLYKIDYRIRKAEFAILIADENYRGKGFGNFCTTYILDYGFNQLNLNRIELTLLSENIQALGLYKKNGFVQEGLLKQVQYKNGKYHDLILMAKLKY